VNAIEVVQFDKVSGQSADYPMAHPKDALKTSRAGLLDHASEAGVDDSRRAARLPDEKSSTYRDSTSQRDLPLDAA
jgi:hypothetical protein